MNNNEHVSLESIDMHVSPASALAMMGRAMQRAENVQFLATPENDPLTLEMYVEGTENCAKLYLHKDGTWSMTVPFVLGPAEIALKTLYHHWDSLQDAEFTISIDDEKFILNSFLHFTPGTSQRDICRWFESKNKRFLVAEVLQGIRHTD